MAHEAGNVLLEECCPSHHIVNYTPPPHSEILPSEIMNGFPNFELQDQYGSDVTVLRGRRFHARDGTSRVPRLRRRRHAFVMSGSRHDIYFHI